MNTIQSQVKMIDPDLGLTQTQNLKQDMNVPAPGAQGVSGPNFFSVLEKSMDEVNQNQLAADQSIKDLVAGKNKNIHETMLAIQKADLSLKTMMQVRNKVLEAYKEIMRMQV